MSILKSRILLISSSPKWSAYNFAMGFKNQGHNVKVTGAISESKYDIDFDPVEWDKLHVPFNDINWGEVDVVYALDHGILPILGQIKDRIPNITCGVQVLDYPKHVFVNNKDYNENAFVRWRTDFWPNLKKCDFVIHNQKWALKEMSKTAHPQALGSHVFFPVKPIYYEEYERKDFIMFCGRLHPDKGVHYIISALSIIPKDIRPSFITVGTGFDFSPLAKHLGVDYKNIENVSEHEKWELYHQCRFTICGADNKYIPTLCVAEGISVNRTGVVFDYEENLEHYGTNVWYVPERNIGSLARTIELMYNDKVLCDDRVSNGKKYYEENLSYDVWARKSYEVIMVAKG